MNKQELKNGYYWYNPSEEYKVPMSVVLVCNSRVYFMDNAGSGELKDLEGKLIPIPDPPKTE